MHPAIQLVTPGIVISVLAFAKFRAIVSPRAEVELSRHLHLGKGAVVSSFTKIKAHGALSIGREVSIATGCFISSESGGIEIGEYTMVGPNSCIIGNNYEYRSLDVPIAKQKKTSKGISIGSGVWLGAQVTVLDGAKIGDGCIIAPNSVVSGGIPKNSIAQGNPAKVIFVRR